MKVYVIELPPRLTCLEVFTAIAELNHDIAQFCEAQGAVFSPTRGYFYLENGHPNDALLDEDRVHLTLKGSQVLLKCMGGELKENKNGVSDKVAYTNRIDKRVSGNPKATQQQPLSSILASQQHNPSTPKNNKKTDNIYTICNNNGQT